MIKSIKHKKIQIIVTHRQKLLTYKYYWYKIIEHIIFTGEIKWSSRIIYRKKAVLTK